MGRNRQNVFGRRVENHGSKQGTHSNRNWTSHSQMIFFRCLVAVIPAGAWFARHTSALKRCLIPQKPFRIRTLQPAQSCRPRHPTRRATSGSPLQSSLNRIPPLRPPPTIRARRLILIALPRRHGHHREPVTGCQLRPRQSQRWKCRHACGKNTFREKRSCSIDCAHHLALLSEAVPLIMRHSFSNVQGKLTVATGVTDNGNFSCVFGTFFNGFAPTTAACM